MFTDKAAMFLYGVSPIHMGAGTALGAIDNPIQRERHTGHPMLAGSGLKGALRHEANRRKLGGPLIRAVFGPETSESSEQAGALSVADAQLVLFPVRSLRESYVYATCPTALRRLGRLLDLADAPVEGLRRVGTPGPDEALCSNDGLLVDGKLVLEAYAFTSNRDEALGTVSDWIATHALARDGMQYFQDKVRKDLVVLHDDRFNYFVRNATVVEPHVRINDDTGTADDGGLFYTENVPPEALFVSLVMASDERTKEPELKARDILSVLTNDLGTRMVQVGGDATTGRGQMVLSFVRGEVQP
ncbi:MAG: type III-B CRISPR module RAMP protein Cmr4 [Myxococcota bacterium]